MPFTDRDDGSVFYVKEKVTKLYQLSKPQSRNPKDPYKKELLWGDRVRLLKNADGSFKKKDNRYRARARGEYGWVRKSDLGGKRLLELYFIDVGQGDGLLIHTPNGRHILIDGGWPRKSQPTGKNASDFVDWKFVKDYESDQIELDEMICSHNDQDHYGGLWDLLDPKQLNDGEKRELDAESVTVERFYHAGLSWWKTPSMKRFLGATKDTSVGKLFTQLIDDRDSVIEGLKSNANPKLQGEWAQFLRKVKDAKKADGTHTDILRLSHAVGVLEGYDGSGSTSGSTAEPTIHVLAPVEFEVDGEPAIRNFDDQASKNTNGNSILLRLDCGDVRMLLTGDLNTLSQDSLLSDYRGSEEVFECDVAKACHHGSSDVSYEFLETMSPLVTIISSGDSEGHDHPKPEIIAASAMSGTKTVKDDKLKTPLIYITELARSVEVGKIESIEEVDNSGDPVHEIDFSSLLATTKVVRSGDRSAETVKRRLEGGRMMTNTVYGLINVRTDGKEILCAALNEKSAKWNYHVLKPKSRS